MHIHLDADGVVAIPCSWLSTYFHTNPHHGKTHHEMTREIREVAAEARKRRVNGNDTDDQWWRAHYLCEARAQLN
ncbi:hypothetical protein IU501_35415 [Nocardia otitidiscaviarum]|uniref:hypothetical protein n=1 Tax=Nocardia otitidiscaviarum TaxID=1823 RepID=UPI0018955D2F|nr:hypothetical protein [Nocardia otitidiscaviarum]MBF6138264.1 hypothetical protein [Nocardia otitidiscaviarum]